MEYKTGENENMIYVENRKKSMKMNRSMLDSLILSKGKLLVRAKGKQHGHIENTEPLILNFS